jgi:hypothetical protein
MASNRRPSLEFVEAYTAEAEAEEARQEREEELANGDGGDGGDGDGAPRPSPGGGDDGVSPRSELWRVARQDDDGKGAMELAPIAMSTANLNALAYVEWSGVEWSGFGGV